MQKPVVAKSSVLTAGVLALAMAGGLTGCGKSETTESLSSASTPADAAAKEAALEARANELAKREAELAAKEEALQMSEPPPEVIPEEPPRSAPAKAPAKEPTVRRVAVAQDPPPARSAPRPAPRIEYVEVPAGTVLDLTLATDLSSRTAVVGDVVEARLASDLIVNGYRVARADARVTGTVRQVVSGSNTIGAVPLIALQFDSLEDLKGEPIAISGEFSAQGNSEKGQDAAKIIGGAAAGAFIGDKIDKKKGNTGAIVGGLLGGAAGAVVAKKTGTEVALTPGYGFGITLANSVRVASN